MNKPTGWRAEFGDEFKVPEKVEAMVVAGTLADLSWHNDVAPSFALEPVTEDGEPVRLWVDHPDPTLSEYPQRTGRFTVTSVVVEDGPVYEGDDIDAALIALKSETEAARLAEPISKNTVAYLSNEMERDAWSAEQKRLWDLVPQRQRARVSALLVPFTSKPPAKTITVLRGTAEPLERVTVRVDEPEPTALGALKMLLALFQEIDAGEHDDEPAVQAAMRVLKRHEEWHGGR